MSGDKISHYYPDAQWSWQSDGDYSTLEWFGPGNKPTEVELDALPWPVAKVPAAVSMRQARLALSRNGLLTNAENAIAGMTGSAGDEARIEWEYATELRRDHPLISALGTALNLEPEDVDDLFQQAAQIA